MEWLLIFYFGSANGSINTERFKTYEECQTIGKIINKDSSLLTINKYVCLEVKKLDR